MYVLRGLVRERLFAVDLLGRCWIVRPRAGTPLAINNQAILTHRQQLADLLLGVVEDFPAPSLRKVVSIGSNDGDDGYRSVKSTSSSSSATAR